MIEEIICTAVTEFLFSINKSNRFQSVSILKLLKGHSMRAWTSIFVLVVLLGVTGCGSKMSGAVDQSMDTQCALDSMGYLEEMHDLAGGGGEEDKSDGKVNQSYCNEISTYLDEGMLGSANKDELKKLLDELRKAKDKEEIQRITGEMAGLIVLPEKYMSRFAKKYKK